MSAVVKNPHHLDMDGHRIANLDDPTSDTEAATKGYVDRAIAAAIAKSKPTVLVPVTDALLTPDQVRAIEKTATPVIPPKPRGV